MTAFPSLYQVNTRALLRSLGTGATLDDIPDAEIVRWGDLGFDWVWMLGVWQTGPAARAVSLANPAWVNEYRHSLPDYTDDDVSGSPFAVAGYHAHVAFGGDPALARLRERLRKRGLKLLLDFVPNHTAPDHPWVTQHPHWYVGGDDEALAREPLNYARVGERVFGMGRDPYFPGWADTLQLDWSNAGLRAAMVGELRRIAGQCDGVRCDMAMLVLPDVFRRTWGREVSAPFWPEATAVTRTAHPGFVFMAEVYWGLEWELQQQGFDYTYDKEMYDRLHRRDAPAVRGHLRATPEYMRKSVRFLENHDEPRAASEFPREVHEAAAVLAFLVPGLRFFHEGQLEGRRVRLSMHLGRRPDEPTDEGLRDFYARLLNCVRRPEVRDGEWRLLDCRWAWDGNSTAEHFIAFGWRGSDGARLLACVNYGPTRGQCFVSDPFGGAYRGRSVALADLLHPVRYEREGTELAERGLYLDVPAYGYHVFDVRPT